MQDICVFETKAFGKVLTLDGESFLLKLLLKLCFTVIVHNLDTTKICITAGVIQTTDKDEFSYQEMITHLALCGLQVRPTIR